MPVSTKPRIRYEYYLDKILCPCPYASVGSDTCIQAPAGPTRLTAENFQQHVSSANLITELELRIFRYYKTLLRI
jgi:hypothetical protein